MSEETENIFQQIDLREKPILLVNRRAHSVRDIISNLKNVPRDLCHPQLQAWFVDDCDLEQVNDDDLLNLRCIRNGAVVDKTKFRIRFEDETESTVRVIIERVAI